MPSVRTAWTVGSLSLVVSLSAGLPAASQTAGATQAQIQAQTQVPTVWSTDVLKQQAGWYGLDATRRLADRIILYQSAQGGWPKNTNLFAPPVGYLDPEMVNTFDNDATTVPMTFLARVIHAGGGTPARLAAFDRGLDYIFAAQYPNGGWPQFFPLRRSYYVRITYNDDAMAHIMVLLREIAAGRPPYEFVDAPRRARAAEAMARGIDVILKTQVVQNGRLTVWCAQHDQVTLAPAPARRIEPASLSGYESVRVARFLMSIPDPSPQVVAAVEGAVAWFRASAIHDMAVQDFTDADGLPDRRLVSSPGHVMWARFYDLRTNRPIFADKTAVIHPALADLERDLRANYGYYTTAAASLIDVDYPAWRARLRRASGSTP